MKRVGPSEEWSASVRERPEVAEDPRKTHGSPDSEDSNRPQLKML